MNKISRSVVWHFENFKYFSNKNTKIILTVSGCDLFLNDIRIISNLLDGTKILYLDNINNNINSNTFVLSRLECITGLLISKVKEGFKINNKVYKSGNIQIPKLTKKYTKYKEGVLVDKTGELFIGKKLRGRYYTWDITGDYHSVDNTPALVCVTEKAKQESIIDVVYFKRGKWHRENAPAVYSGTVKEYWINDKLHREDGPAVEYPANTGGRHDKYYLKGVSVEKEKIDELVLLKQLKILMEL